MSGGACVVGAIISDGTRLPGVRLGRRVVEPIVVEIVQALLVCGGAAHRQVVADHIASVRTGIRQAASRGLQAEVYDGFQRYLDVASRRRTPLLHRPLGDASHRWALTPSGQLLLAGKLPAALRKAH